ncbi:MAG: Formate dehydrogenase family accessory protein FdhD [Pseudomonadota bacterium]
MTLSRAVFTAAVRLDRRGINETAEQIPAEEPLQLRLADHILGTTLRTPGHDRELAVGFLLSEGLIRGAADLSSIAPCGRPDEPGYGNVLNVTPSPGYTLETDPLARAQRRSHTSSACGLCGRQSIEDLRSLCTPIESSVTLPFEALLTAVRELGERQPLFERTGGTHAAGLLSVGLPQAGSGCQWEGVFEDIGRHNAVDKALGHAALRQPNFRTQDPSQSLADVLVVSSRAGFEIVHKACVAQVPIVACVSAPTSLAVETARAFGLTLVGFAREDRVTVYTWPGRILESFGHAPA